MDQQLTGILFISALVAYIVWGQIKKGRVSKLVRAAVENGALVVDVRTSGEYGSGHYPEAINYPLDTLEKKSGKLGSKERSIVVYCASGSRSAQASALLRRLGFTNVLNAGGLSSMPPR